VFTAQAFINLGVAAQFLPSKGMTLPFLSNGGSSMVALGITMGAILAFTRRDPVPQGRGLEGRV
jgi:cell division protein FtsW